MKPLFFLCGAALIAAAVGLILKRSGTSELSPLTAAAGLLLLISLFLPRLREALDAVSRLMAVGGLGRYGTLMLKALGIGFVVKIAGDLCRGLGEEPIAGYLETAGKIEILLLCLPLFSELLDLIRETLP